LGEQARPQSDYKFENDVRALLLKKAGDTPLADDILKRWLTFSNEAYTPDKVDEIYPTTKEDLRFHLVRNQLAEANGIKVEDAEIETYARQMAKSQFEQYGLFNVEDTMLNNYANDLLKKKETVNSVVERLLEQKLANWVKGKVDVETKEVSLEEFEKLFV
jgi:trigger factor